VAADLLETIADLRTDSHYADRVGDPFTLVAHEKLATVLDAAESHARLLRLLAEMDPRASYRIPACDALEAVEQEMARERGGEERGT
jgi:hypothetical protein